MNFPNGLYLTFRIKGGDWFNISECEIIDYGQSLNLREGIFH